MAEAKNDYAFIEYQQDLFQKQLTKIADLCIYASSRQDADFNDFHEKLQEQEICDGDWRVHIKLDLLREKNYALPVTQKYLQRYTDINKEEMRKEVENVEDCNLLRRIVLVNDIEKMIINE